MANLVGLLVPLTYVVLILAERFFPARRFMPLPRWRIRGLLFFISSGIMINALPHIWSGWVRAHRLLDLERLGTAGGFLVAVVVTDLLMYTWHRVRHHVPALWRLHQMHHSVERLDVASAFYFHPLEVAAVAFLTTGVAALLVGVNADAAALTGYFGFFTSVFTHTNIRTPRWLGLLIQRPEAHAVHHERGVHAFNYGGLALWDAVFRTYQNPAAWEGQAGFWDGASCRVSALLRGRDVAR